MRGEGGEEEGDVTRAMLTFAQETAHLDASEEQTECIQATRSSVHAQNISPAQRCSPPSLPLPLARADWETTGSYYERAAGGGGEGGRGGGGDAPVGGCSQPTAFFLAGGHEKQCIVAVEGGGGGWVLVTQ